MKEDLLTWSRHYLSEHFSLPASTMHRWLGRELDTLRQTPGKKINVVGPRGSAKSTLVTLAFVLREALEEHQPYIWIVSDTKQQAIAHLENVTVELAENECLKGDYKELTRRGRTWRRTAVVLRNKVKIEAFGAGQRIRGHRSGRFRPTLIVCDDLQNDGHIQSALTRNLCRGWFHGMLMNAGSRRTNVVSLGTALHRECVAMELLRTPGWTSRVFPAIGKWPERMELWSEWEQIYCDVEREDAKSSAREFYEARQQEMDAGVSLLWPEHEDLYTLMCMRAESGRTAFEREKQGVPANPDLCEWPEEYFGDGIWFEQWPGELRARVMALDPSKGADARRGDYSAFVMLGVAHDGQMYVDADLARRPTPQIVDVGIELCRRFQPQILGIETNQCHELLGTEFVRRLGAAGLISIGVKTIDNQLNKWVRLYRLGPHLAARRLRFKAGSPSARMLVDQLKDFPIADHDDGPDAMEMAIRLAESFLQPAPPPDNLGPRLI